jgi:hypothetical protein
MTKIRFNPPLNWENWCGWLLAIWLCISPGPLKFGDDLTATYIAVLTGILLVGTEMLTISPFRLWKEWINVLVGCWLVAAPWLFHIQNSSAKINFVIVGAFVGTFALYKLWYGAIDRQGAIGRLDS